MKNIILKAENISKQYRLGQVGTGTIKHDFNRFWHKIRGKEDPYLKVGAVNDRSSKAKEEYVWALRDINFEVQEGEVLGIIGKNGAGKSTLLKILSRVTSPTTGVIKTKGRIASLLEVGTGFHPELTGRENIYLNGAILGMTRAEITAKLDEIVEFSGCEMYIDTPTKRYSSGMTVRLAFAVAAHLEPDILVVDEVLAVGDAEFQKKAIGKMQDISKGEGRTVLFVSHNMAAVKSLCNRVMVIDHGLTVFEGNTDEGVEFYLKKEKENYDLSTSKFWDLNNAPGNNNAKILSLELKTHENSFFIEKEIQVEIQFINYLNNHSINTTVAIYNDKDIHILTSPNLPRIPLMKGTYISKCIIPKDFLNKGRYFFTILLVGENFEIISHLEKIIILDCDEIGNHREGYFGVWPGAIRPKLKWNNIKID